MSDTKLSDLPNLATISTDDLVYVVHEELSVPSSFQATVGALLDLVPSPSIPDVDGLQTALDGKASLSGANTFAANQTLNSAGSTSEAPRTIVFTIGAGQYSRIGIAGTANSIQGGNGQLTQFNSWLPLVLDGDRQAAAPAFMADGTVANVSTLIRSTRATSRPLVVQGATSQSANLQEWWNSVGAVVASISPGGVLTITGNTLRVTTSRTPASATAAGNAGDICWDSNYLYICTATNTWRRVAHATW